MATASTSRPAGVDIDCFADTVDAARTLEPDAAAEQIDLALARVRGRPFDDVADELWAMPAAAAAAELVAAAEELWAHAVLASGRAGDDIARLRSAATAQPHREVRWLQLVDRTGRRRAPHRGPARGRARHAGRSPSSACCPARDLLDLERSLVGAPDEPAGGRPDPGPPRSDGRP